jgi:hypothetical protein
VQSFCNNNAAQTSSIPPLPIAPIDDNKRSCDLPSIVCQCNSTNDNNVASSANFNATFVVDSSLQLARLCRRRGLRYLLYVGAFLNSDVLMSQRGGMLTTLSFGLYPILLRDTAPLSHAPSLPPYVAHDVARSKTLAWLQQHVAPTLSVAQLMHDIDNRDTDADAATTIGVVVLRWQSSIDSVVKQHNAACRAADVSCAAPVLIIDWHAESNAVDNKRMIDVLSNKHSIEAVIIDFLSGKPTATSHNVVFFFGGAIFILTSL